MKKNELRLIDYAVEDFRRYATKNKALRQSIFKKLLYIETQPVLAGLPLTGPLNGMRKIVVGDRIWRIVWRVLTSRTPLVWGIGKRDHADIYREVERRIKLLGEDPHTVTIAEMLSSLQERVKPVVEREDIPREVLEALYHEMELSIQTIETLSAHEAISLYERYLQKVVKEL